MESVSAEEEARYDPDLNDEKSMLLRPVNSSWSNLRHSTDRDRQSDCPLGDNGKNVTPLALKKHTHASERRTVGRKSLDIREKTVLLLENRMTPCEQLITESAR